MVYSPGNRDYQTAFTAPFGRSGRSVDESRLPSNLFIAVAVLGLASYGLSFGPVVDGGGATGWYVRFAALAGLSAALGLASRSRLHPLVTAVLAAMGFLDALSSQLLSPNPGWALTVIVILNAVQAAIAIAALLLGRKAGAGTSAVGGYEAYVEYYNQAVRNYYGQQSSAPPEALQQAGYGQAYGAQSAHAAQQTQRTSQHGEYSDFVSAQGDYGVLPVRRQSRVRPRRPAGCLGSGQRSRPPVGKRQRPNSRRGRPRRS